MTAAQLVAAPDANPQSTASQARQSLVKRVRAGELGSVGRHVNRKFKLGVAGCICFFGAGVAVVAALLIPMYRAQFDMEMSYTDMIARVRGARVASAIGSFVAVVGIHRRSRSRWKCSGHLSSLISTPLGCLRPGWRV